MNTHLHAVRPAAVPATLLCAVVACLQDAAASPTSRRTPRRRRHPRSRRLPPGADSRETRGRGCGEPVEGRLLRRDARAHVLFARRLHRRRPDHRGQGHKFAQGGDVVVNGKHNIGRPLDWVAVSDHAEFIGEVFDAGSGCQGRRQPDARGTARPQVRGRAACLVHEYPQQQRAATPYPPPFYAGPETTRSAWRDVEIKAAIDNYRPGQFTTLAGFERTPPRTPGTCIATSSSVT